MLKGRFIFYVEGGIAKSGGAPFSGRFRGQTFFPKCFRGVYKVYIASILSQFSAYVCTIRYDNKVI